MPDTKQIPVLAMENVAVPTLKDPDRIVLEEVNWTVLPGDFWVVVGLHRSGKSDLLALSAGLMPPARGTCRVLGRELATAAEDEQIPIRRRLTLVFDGGQLLHHLTVAENVALPIRYHANLSMAEAIARMQPLLELTGLTPWADVTPAMISRNWQQRAGLARALALKPEVLLLDTPLTGLDPHDAAWWLELLSQLSAGHPLAGHVPITLIVTGDDLRPWKGRARQAAALRKGKFIPLAVERLDPSAPDEALMRELL